MPARLRWTRRAVAVTVALLVVAVGTSTADPVVAPVARAVVVATDVVRPAGQPVPDVVPRSTWDPDGTCPPSDGARTVPARIHLHHTHVPVVATPEEVPGALRAICGAHRRRGFDDIGYHYAIDPFGTIWQARGPLPADLRRRVREGAHAQGFNAGSIGVVLIGDFDLAPPTPAAMAATTDLLAFLAEHLGIDPSAAVGAVSTGGPRTRFPEGTEVTLPAIAGHRDTGNGTTCPGAHLYALLPGLRAEVAARLSRPPPATR